jgi:hypothetical protein
MKDRRMDDVLVSSFFFLPLIFDICVVQGAAGAQEKEEEEGQEGQEKGRKEGRKEEVMVLEKKWARGTAGKPGGMKNRRMDDVLESSFFSPLF